MAALEQPAPARAVPVAKPPAPRLRLAAVGVLVACGALLLSGTDQQAHAGYMGYWKRKPEEFLYAPGSTPYLVRHRMKFPFLGKPHLQHEFNPKRLTPLPVAEKEYIERVPKAKVEKEPVSDDIIKRWAERSEAGRIFLLPEQPDRGYVSGGDAVYHPPPDPALPKLKEDKDLYPQENRHLFEKCDVEYANCYKKCARLKIVEIEWVVNECKWQCFTARRNCFYFAANPPKARIDKEPTDELQPLYDWKSLRNDAMAKKPLRRSLTNSM